MDIRKLDSDVVDKIAAGEVVERPSHLLKELIENSLDAGASEIDIEIDEGGKSIKVTDDGKGVEPKQLPLVFARHATSKIQESEDLWRLSTFGFRGEALASISSVSRLNFTSRRSGSDKAFRVHCNFGEVGDVAKVSSQEGTTVQVEELFANIPARLKFLKSDSAEVTQIKNVIKAMALAHFNVRWKVKVKGKLLFFWEACSSMEERAKQVLETQNLYSHKAKSDNFEVEVVFSDPSTTVKVSRQIWLFVQNRWVQDKTLQAAVMEAYRSLLMHGEYPVCVINVKCPPDTVDVNIHPTKSQVKFLHQREAFRAVHWCLREALEKAPWIPSGAATKVREKPVETIVPNLEFQQSSFLKTQFKQKSLSPIQEIKMADLQKAASIPVEDFVESSSPTSSLNQDEEVKKASNYWSKLQVIGQVNLTYIVAQSEDSMIIVDQHAAHERVAFERLMRDWKTGSVEQQNFLLPLTLDLEKDEVEALLELQPEIEKMGALIEQSGPSTLSVMSCPSFIKESGLVKALEKLARERVEKGGSFALETSIADIFATMACHSVIRAGQALSLEEMKALLEDMDEFPLSSFCPHGRNVSIVWKFSGLERDFGRTQ